MLRRLLLILAFVLPAHLAAAQCVGSGGVTTLADCAGAISLQRSDIVLGYEYAQTPHTRAPTIAQILGLLESADVTGALGFTPLAPANNLSDVGSAATALGNLGGAPRISSTVCSTTCTVPVLSTTKLAHIVAFGQGGCGGGGARENLGTVGTGGAGGGSGYRFDEWFQASDLPSSVTATFSTPCTGGAGASSVGPGTSGTAGAHVSINVTPTRVVYGGGGGESGETDAVTGGGGGAGANGAGSNGSSGTGGASGSGINNGVGVGAAGGSGASGTAVTSGWFGVGPGGSGASLTTSIAGVAAISCPSGASGGVLLASSATTGGAGAFSLNTNGVPGGSDTGGNGTAAVPGANATFMGGSSAGAGGANTAGAGGNAGATTGVPCVGGSGGGAGTTAGGNGGTGGAASFRMDQFSLLVPRDDNRARAAIA